MHKMKEDQTFDEKEVVSFYVCRKQLFAINYLDIENLIIDPSSLEIR